MLSLLKPCCLFGVYKDYNLGRYFCKSQRLWKFSNESIACLAGYDLFFCFSAL